MSFYAIFAGFKSFQVIFIGLKTLLIIFTIFLGHQNPGPGHNYIFRSPARHGYQSKVSLSSYFGHDFGKLSKCTISRSKQSHLINLFVVCKVVFYSKKVESKINVSEDVTGRRDLANKTNESCVAKTSSTREF